MKLLKVLSARTLETRIIPNKKASEEAICLNGTSNGRELEDNCIRFAQQLLHNVELIDYISRIIYL